MLSEQEVAVCLAHINAKKAPGPDGLKGRVLKACRHQLKGPLTELFQKLLNANTVPHMWKILPIIPIPKGSGGILPDNFRPVALTSVFAKCMERIISKNIMSSLSII